MSDKRFAATNLCLLGLLCTPLPAQVSSIYGSLRVTVADAAGARVPNAEVEVRLPDRNWVRVSRTPPQGVVYFASLTPAEYEVTVSALDLGSETRKVAILLGHEASLEFALRPAARREQVTVTAAAGVDAYTIPVHTHVSSHEIHQLPVNQRNYLDFVLLDAGLQRDTLRVHAVAVTSGFNVMGQRPRNNSLQLDGSDLNDESAGGVRGSVPMDAVREFQVLTSGYQAEYGRASGGVVNVVTKSGSNELHGGLFGFLRHRSLDATNSLSALKDPPYTRTQYGASLSGPLRADRTFAFLAFEQLRRQESAFSRIGANPAPLGLTAEQQRLKAADPAHPAVLAAERGMAIAWTGIDPRGASPGYGVTPLQRLGGVFPISQRVGTYMLRLDHHFSKVHRLATRLNYAHDKLSSLEAQNNDQIAGLLSPGRTAALAAIDPAAVVTLNTLAGPRLINDARFSWGRRRFEMTPNSFDPPVNIPGVAFIGRENILPHYRTEKHYHADDALTIASSSHIFKAGGDLMFCPTKVDYHRLTNGLFVFGPQPAPGAPLGSPQLTPVQAYGLGLAANFSQQFGDPRSDAGKRSAGIFAQDSWRIGERLTADFGLRYDIETVASREPSTPEMAAVYRHLAIRRSPPADRNNVQPRIGFALQALDAGRLTVRGSYGLFSDRLLNLSTYIASVSDGGQMRGVILTGPSAAAVFQSPLQKLPAYPGSQTPTGLIAFSGGWALGYTQQSNLLLTSQVRPELAVDLGYVWVKGTHLPRSRDFNAPDGARNAAFLAAGNPQSMLLMRNFLRPLDTVSEVMAFENSANSTYHGLRTTLRGKLGPGLTVNASYVFSKAIDDAEEIFPHTRAQNMHDFRSERGLALYDQRHRAVFAAVYQSGRLRGQGALPVLLSNWTLAPILEAGAGRPVNVLLGFDNNLNQDPGSDRPDVVPAGAPGGVRTRLGTFAVPPAGKAGNLGRNVFTGPGYASLSLRLGRSVSLSERTTVRFTLEGFNVLNRTNIRAVNPTYAQAGEPLAAFDPRQVQLGLRLEF